MGVTLVAWAGTYHRRPRRRALRGYDDRRRAARRPQVDGRVDVTTQPFQAVACQVDRAGRAMSSARVRAERRVQPMSVGSREQCRPGAVRVGDEPVRPCVRQQRRATGRSVETRAGHRQSRDSHAAGSSARTCVSGVHERRVEAGVRTVGEHVCSEIAERPRGRVVRDDDDTTYVRACRLLPRRCRGRTRVRGRDAGQCSGQPSRVFASVICLTGTITVQER